MSLRSLLRTSIFHKVLNGEFLQPSIACSNPLRFKHWNPKWKKYRAAKVFKVKLPDFEEHKKDYEEMSEDEIRSKLKERGVLPEYPQIEKPMYISSTGDFFEPYVPPEGDGKVSKITKEGAKQTWELVEKKGKSMWAIRKVRSYDEDFEIADFLIAAQDIYIKAHEAMTKNDPELLQQYVTEKAYPEVMHNTARKTIHWKFLQSIEPPRVVHARCTDIITKDNKFGQITVRFHSQQVLAVYDRFGRLIHGSEILAKDVLEYVVFEKHLSNRYGVWRIHGKIIPDWKPLPEPGIRTYVIEQNSDPESKELSQVSDSQKSDESSQPPPSQTSQSTTDSPQLSVA